MSNKLLRFDPRRVLVSDLDACLVNTWEMVQMFCWDRWNVWVPMDECLHFQVSRSIWGYLKDRGADVPTIEDLEQILVNGLWTVPFWYHEARPNWAYWRAMQVRWDKDPESVYFLTARPHNLKAVTAAWLERWGFCGARDRLYVEGRSADKLPVLEEIANSIGDPITFVDDRLDTVQQVIEATDRVETVLMARPWNRSDGLMRLSEDQIAREILDGLA